MKICKNCSVSVDNYLKENIEHCGNCGYKIVPIEVPDTPFNGKTYSTTKERIKDILEKFENSRNDDWQLLDLFTEHFTRIESPGTIIRLRAEVQNRDKILLPTEDVRKRRRKAQLDMSHKFGGQTI